MDKAQATEALKMAQQLTGQEQVICRPLFRNVPEVPEGAMLTTCPRCGRKCWKMKNEPDQLPVGVTAACTECALRASANRARQG